MNNPYTTLLRDPSPDRLLATLRAAGEASGISHDQDFWNGVLLECGRTLQGNRQVERKRQGGATRYLLLAWWTDHRGGRLYRVVGGRMREREQHIHWSRLDEDLRPPLWHIAPGKIFSTGTGCWLAACACGVVGPPEQLAWMGSSCGPCHDRREEGDVSAPVDLPEIFQVGRPVRDLAFSPDSRLLAVALAGCGLILLDRTGHRQTLLAPREEHHEESEATVVAFSPDQQFLAIASACPGEIRVFHIDEDPITSFTLDLGSRVPVRQMGFTCDGRWFVVSQFDGRLQVWQVEYEDWPRHLFTDRNPPVSFAFGQEGGMVVGARNQGLEQFDRAMRPGACFAEHAWPDQDVLYLDYCLGGQHLIVLTGVELSLQTNTQQCLSLMNRNSKSELRRKRLPRADLVGLDPAGRYLARIVDDLQQSAGGINFWDLQTWQECARLEWHPEMAFQALAFAPDGQTLGTGNRLGLVKLWPWRALVEN